MTQPNFNPTILEQIQYGMFIVTATTNGKNNGQIATVVMQVTAKPIQVAVCLNKLNLTHQLIMTNEKFGVSILSEEANLKFIGKFGFHSGRDCDKFTAVKYKKLTSGVPLILDYTTSILDLQVTQTIDIGTHTLFVGKLLAAEKVGNFMPMSYNYYHKVIKGKTHKNAPTFYNNNNSS